MAFPLCPAFCFAAFVVLLPLTAPGQVPAPPLTEARQLRVLPPAQAALGMPVRIRGTVTMLDPGRTIFLQDASGGTFVSSETHHAGITRGTEISVEGVTFPGLYLPGIIPSRIRVHGQGQLPLPRSVTLDELSSGRFNYEWVQVRGIVRAVEPSEAGTLLHLALGDGLLEVHAPAGLDGSGLVDAEVRMEGLAAGFINDRRQLVAPHLRVASPEAITIDGAPPAASNDLPAVPFGELLQFSPRAAPGHRIKVSGVLTHHEPGESLYLRDGTRGLYVQTRQAGEAKAGDHVEAVGFPEMGPFSAVLRHASFRVTGSGPPPAPVPVGPPAILTGQHDADLVSITGHVLKFIPGEQIDTLLLQTGDAVFPAKLPAAPGAVFRPGTLLRVVGVCHVSQSEQMPVGFRSRPREFEILLRSLGDLTVLRVPSWWSAQRLGVAAGLLLAAVLAVLAWAAALRIQVLRQTRLLGKKIQAEAVLEERHRIAREFHDTLEQELVGVAIRLDALATRVVEDKPRELLGETRRLVQRLQTESRGFVWDLRESTEALPDLAEALAQSITGLSIPAEFTTTGVARRLPPVAEHHLLRIAQEAIGNACKHAQAGRLTVQLAYQPEGVLLRVEDDGVGFDPETSSGKPGHFGLLGMRERAKRVGGKISIGSAGDTGSTVVEVSVPFPPSSQS